MDRHTDTGKAHQFEVGFPGAGDTQRLHTFLICLGVMKPQESLVGLYAFSCFFFEYMKGEF